MAEKTTKKAVNPKAIKSKAKAEPKIDEAVVVKKEAPNTLTPTDQKEVKVIERVIESQEISPADAFGKLTRNQINLIKTTVAKGASDDELRLFIQVCKGANLNPFMKQVHLIPRWDSRSGKEVRTIQVGIDGFRAVAESSGMYAGNDDPIFAETKVIQAKTKKIDVPLTAKVTVYKLLQGKPYAFSATARWDEYYPGERIGFQWHIRPYLMLGKCAEALALRKAFPKLLSGMYAQEEMDKTIQINPEEVTVQKGLITLIKLIKNSTLEVIEEYKAKMEASDKYSKAQKAEFLQAVDARIKELNAEKIE